VPETTASMIDPDEINAAWDDIFPSSIAAARGQRTATPEQVDLEDMQPTGKKPSKSKLRMSWGPEDVEEVEASVESSPVLAPSSTAETSATSVRVGNTKVSSAARKRRNSDNLPCPLCLKRPFHLRYRCPVIEAGPDAIEKRLEELKSEDASDHVLLIEELEHLLLTHRTKGNVSKSGSAGGVSLGKPTANFSPMNATSTPAVRPSRRPIIPSESRMSEVNVETRDEGSSNEGSDDDESDDDDDTHSDRQSESQYPYKLPSAFGNVSFADMDLDAIIRGPLSQSKSILHEVPSGSDSEEDEDVEPEEEDDEDEDDRQYRMRSKKLDKAATSSDEGEDPDVPANGGSVDEDVAIDESPKTLPQPAEDGAIQAGSQDTSASCDDLKLTSVTGGRWFEWFRR
jgi:hypothetical protein